MTKCNIRISQTLLTIMIWSELYNNSSNKAICINTKLYYKETTRWSYSILIIDSPPKPYCSKDNIPND